MGWFWADDPSATSSTPKRTVNSSTDAPPQACPMHSPPQKVCPPNTTSSCPVTPTDAANTSTTVETDNRMNPLNFMYSHLSQNPSPGQQTKLPTTREPSTIPRGDGGNWEYPSPQQMYNAMRRKGYDDAPEDAVESMVAIHNWINEGAWAEITEWERKFGAGVLGYLGLRERPKDSLAPKLGRFHGRRDDISPKAALYGVLGRIMPETFAGEPPFDRHDWYVLRQFPGEDKPREIRYVIDYYSGPPEPTGEPVFYLDVRPAIDRPGLMMERIINWTSDVWEKASGIDVRRRERQQREMENAMERMREAQGN